MYYYRYLKLFCLLLCSQFAIFTASGQVKYAFVRDTVQVKGGETFSAMLQVDNAYNFPVTLKQDTKNELVRGLISLPDSLVLKAGESRKYPLKYIADRQTINTNLQEFKVRLVSANPLVKLQPFARFRTILADAKGLTITTESDEIYLSQLSNQVQIMLRCVNNGFVPLTFRLLLTGIPDGLEFTGQISNFTLPPGAQQMLPFLARNKGGVRVQPDFTVTIQALDDANHELAAKMIRIVNVTSAGRIGQGNDQFAGNLPNSVALRYANLNSDYSFLQLLGNGKMNTAEGNTLSYQLNVDRYQQGGFNWLNIYNSYLAYNTKNWELKAGNIYENMDFQLSGRGVKVAGKLSAEETISVYGLENNFMLYAQGSKIIPGARIAAIEYKLTKPGVGDTKLTYMHRRDRYTELDADQWNANTGFRFNEEHLLLLEGGYSIEKPYVGSAESKQAVSAGLNYTYSSENFKIYSSTHYTSPYFTGLRRGQFIIDQRLVKPVTEHSTLNAHTNIQVNKPRFQDTRNLLNYGVNGNSLYNYGMDYTATMGKFYMQVGPYYLGQRLVTQGFSAFTPMAINWKSASARLLANVGYNGRLQSFSASADYGYTYVNSSERPPAPYQSLKVNTNYTFAFFSLTGYLQLNPFYLTDVLSARGDNHYTVYSLGPNVHFSAFKRKLTAQAGGTYNYYGFTKTNNYMANGSMRYLLKGHWSFTADIQYTVVKQTQLYFPDGSNNQLTPGYIEDLPLSLQNQYSGNRYTYENRQLRLGIEKQFGRNGNGGNKKLGLTYYQDENNNGKRDGGELPVTDILVKIKNDVAITNAKGEVIFKNMDKEAYTVSVTNTKGWSLQEPTEVFLDKSKDLEIPLVKTQALNGLLKVKATQYLKSKPELAGIRVKAIDQNGRVHQTLTNDDGGFCLYLPRNKYTVSVETEGMPFSIENGAEQVSLEGKPLDLLTFIYKDEHRKVGVTRF